jgi:hypothetical protein
MTTNAVGALHASGQATVHVGNYYSNDVHPYNERNANRFLADLRLTDPRIDKTRIEQTKGGLLRDSYKWILERGDFRRWRDGKDSRLLWIKGDAGKGKTMLLCRIVDELQQSLQGLGAKARARDQLGGMVSKLSRQFRKLSLSPAPLSFFFCQGTDSRLNHATAVLWGLIYLLLLNSRLLSSPSKRGIIMPVGVFSMAQTRSTLCHKLYPGCSAIAARRDVTWLSTH